MKIIQSNSRFVALFVGYVFSILFSCTADSSHKGSFVVDNAKEFSAAQQKMFDSIYSVHEKKTTNQIVLLTINSYHPASSLFDYAMNAYKDLDIGTNGLLILLCTPCRKIQILTGRATEKVLPDDSVRSVINETMKPYFIKGNYYGGVYYGSLRLTKYLEDPKHMIK